MTAAHRMLLLCLPLVVVVTAQQPHPDIRAVVDVIGANPGGRSWADSYSVGDDCYCSFSSFDNGRISFFVEVSDSNGNSKWLSLMDICSLLGPGPGIVEGTTPLYNDVQCGNGPPNDAGDEHTCPGRVDIGPAGCGHVGPRWNFGTKLDSIAALPSASANADVRVVLPNVIGANPGGRSWADSYSVGNDCYCSFSTFDHGIGTFLVEVPSSTGTTTTTVWKSVETICDELGPGPGIVEGTTPLYNDVQCGNGPPNDAGDEHTCPGRVDIGRGGCGHVGPKWNLVVAEPPVVCFSGETSVIVKDKGEISMADLKLGDKVLVDTDGTFEPVYSFGHYSPDMVADYLQFLPSGIEISMNHMVMVIVSKKDGDDDDDEEETSIIPASEVQVGHVLRTTTTSDKEVQEIRQVKSTGAFAPFTMSGTIVVNGVQASTYVTLQPNEDYLVLFGSYWKLPITHHWLAHSWQSLHRLRVRFFGVARVEEYTDGRTGVSKMVDQPHQWATWLLSSHPVLSLILLMLILPVLVLLNAIEGLVSWLFM